MKKIFIIPLLLAVLLLQCTPPKPAIVNDADILRNSQQKLTEVIIYDIFSPPVASRIYAYSSLASYEAIRFQNPGTSSITDKLNGFGSMPQPEASKKYNYTLAATEAFFTVVHKLVFSLDSLKDYEDQVHNQFRQTLNDSTYQNSIVFGDSIGKAILARAAKDNYLQTRGMSKYLGSKDDGKWQPTSPDYFDGTEPFWSLLKPLSLDTNAQFRPAPPVVFSEDSTSTFYNMVKEVYNASKNITDSQQAIARYWDDNPFVMEHSGHLSFATKKITPGGHWMGITSIATSKANVDAVNTAKAFALTAVALFDGFISCWDAKYTYEYVRPISVINNWFQKDWDSFLQTPPFPEYTSGHSTISGAASTTLTALFGDNFAFHDNSDSAYIGMTRDFNSFNQAAAEASISRFYGGIHFRSSLDTGLAKGELVGVNLLKKLQLP